MEHAVIEHNGNSQSELNKIFEELMDDFADRAARYDQDNSFVKENYDLLKQHGFFSAAIPRELGGMGFSHSEMGDMLRRLAHACSSTALAFSMHQHLIAANVWRYNRGQGGGEMLSKVANAQLVLVSTGAMDWLSSNGEMKKTDKGFFFNGKKPFASQSPVGNILVTSGAYEDPDQGWQVLHFPVPMNAQGVSVLDNWDAMGMRGTGSNTVVLENVFIPESSVVLRRQRYLHHPFFNVVMVAALPMIMSVYVGIAEEAAEIATHEAMKKNDEETRYLMGEMRNELTVAQTLWRDMIRLANNLDFDPTNEIGNEAAIRKTIIADACIKTVAKAMEIGGGKAYLKESKLERLFRDVHGAMYHPVQAKKQHYMTGKYLLTNSF